MKHKGQIAIEYLLLTAMGFFFLFTFLAVIIVVSNSKQDEKTYAQLTDLGNSLQQEVLLATTLQDGYKRELYLPDSFYGTTYTIITDNASLTQSYFTINFDNHELYYVIPHIIGTFNKGTTVLRKDNGVLSLT